MVAEIHQSGFPVGETIVGAAAVGAALLTAWMAERRLNMTLKEERARHTAELAHDREMRDLDELRSTLDDIGSRLAAIRFTGLELEEALPAPASSGAAANKLEALSVQFDREAVAIRSRYERLALRLGGFDPLCVCLAAADEACGRIQDAAAAARKGGEADGNPNIARLAAAVAFFAGVFGGTARVRFANQFGDEEGFDDFRVSLREMLEERDRDVELELLTSVESVMGVGPAAAGEDVAAAVSETSDPPSALP